MSGRRLAAVLAPLLALLAPLAARADGVVCEGKVRADAEAAVRRGGELEKAGQPFDALQHYRWASENCDFPAIAAGVRSAGRALAAAALKAGRAWGTGGCVTTVTDPAGCRRGAPRAPGCFDEQRVVPSRDAHAYCWYEDTGNAAESDALVLKLVAERPADLELFRFGWGHFARRGDPNAREPAGAPRATLQASAAAQAKRALAAEPAEWARKQTELGGNSVGRSLGRIQESLSWTEAAALDGREAKARAEQRGDERARAETAIALGEASRFYAIAGAEAKLVKLRARALALGEKAEARGERAVASGYYTVAGAEERARALAPSEAELKATEVKARQSVDGLLKKDDEKKKFDAETKDLEKELGL